MLAWLKRFGLHMAAAIGATGIFVAAAAVGANQTRQQVTALRPTAAVSVSIALTQARNEIAGTKKRQPHDAAGRRVQKLLQELHVTDVLRESGDDAGVAREFHRNHRRQR